jgi:predicted nucleic acid-binding protein
MIPPEQALLFVGEVRERLTVVTLTIEEYMVAIENSAARGFSPGRVYDALLLACAIKAKAQVIYTWNLKHYQALAPQMAGTIRTP